MDVTFRSVDEAIFRRFKARCAELGISLGQGFNISTTAWLGGYVPTSKEQKEWNKDEHLLHDLGAHITALHESQAAKKTMKK